MKRERKSFTISFGTNLPPHRLDAEIMRLARELRALVYARGIDIRASSHKGKTIPPEQRAKIAAKLKGRTFSEESRKRMSESQKGKRLTPAHRAKVSRGLLAGRRA